MQKIYYYSDKVADVMRIHNIYIDSGSIAELPIGCHNGEFYGLVRFTYKLPSIFDECICSWYK